jgi:hypothetical protein
VHPTSAVAEGSQYVPSPQHTPTAAVVHWVVRGQAELTGHCLYAVLEPPPLTSVVAKKRLNAGNLELTMTAKYMYLLLNADVHVNDTLSLTTSDICM